MELTLDALLHRTIEQGATDMHLQVGKPPLMRIGNRMRPLPDCPILSEQEILEMLKVMPKSIEHRLHRDDSTEFSYAVHGLARFRGTAFYQQGSIAAVFRQVPKAASKLVDD